MNTVPLKNWRNILLDTSVIIKLFHALGNTKDDECKFVFDLLRYLSNNKAELRDSASPEFANRQFYISTITISEIWSKSTNKTHVERITNALQAQNVVFVSFDEEIAQHINDKYHRILSNQKLNKFAEEISFRNDFKMAREWILKDVMIIATSDYMECDVLLTNDKNTLIPMADKLDVFSALCHPDYFEYNGDGTEFSAYKKPD